MTVKQIMNWKFGKRLYGLLATLSLLLGLGGVYDDAKTWGGWLTSNPYVTGACFGIGIVSGLLFIVSQWSTYFVQAWHFILKKYLRLDKHAMSILRKEEHRLDKLLIDLSRCYKDKRYRSSHFIDTLLELHATGELLDFLGVPSPQSINKNDKSDEDFLLEWMVFIRALLTRIRHGEMSDVRSTLEDIDYPDSEEAKHDD